MSKCYMQIGAQIITKIFIQVVHVMDLIYMIIVIVNFYILHMTVHTIEHKYIPVL